MARALGERDEAMEQRALSLAEEAIAGGHGWVRSLGEPPLGAAKRERWMREVCTVAAYRDRWHVEGERALGAAPDREDLDRTAQRKRAFAAGGRAKAVGMETVGRPTNAAIDPQVEIPHGIEL
jgi:hypothetical protein